MITLHVGDSRSDFGVDGLLKICNRNDSTQCCWIILFGNEFIGHSSSVE